MGSWEEEVVLLDFWASGFGMRVRIALAEKGIPYDHRQEILAHKTSLLLHMNPVYHKVPVLIHKGKPVCESSIIVQYIDEVWKDKSPPLLPADPYLRAQARFWFHYVDNKVYDAGRRIWITRGEEQEKAKEEFIGCLKVLEEQLGEKPYFMGETFGYADIAFVPFYCFFYSFETFGNFSIEKECPKLIQWAKRCMQRESVFKSLPDPHKIYDYVFDLVNKLS